MGDRNDPQLPSEERRGGAAGPRINVRRGIQGAIGVAAVILFFTAPRSIDRRLLLSGMAAVVVLVDLVMLFRGDIDYTHFQSREWSFRVNAALLVLAIVWFAWVYTGR